MRPLSIVSLLTVGLLTGCGANAGDRAGVNQYDGIYNVNDYTGRVNQFQGDMTGRTNQFQGRNYDTTGRAVPDVNDRVNGMTRPNDARMGTLNNRFGTGSPYIYDNNYDDRVITRGTTTQR